MTRDVATSHLESSFKCYLDSNFYEFSMEIFLKQIDIFFFRITHFDLQ
jgi:hypothetical protein